jgi:hypothetical protein
MAVLVLWRAVICVAVIAAACGVWRPSSDCAELADGGYTSCAVQSACKGKFVQLKSEEATDEADAPWTKEEEDALTAGMAGCTSWSELPPLLKKDSRLAARGKASLVPCWLARQTHRTSPLCTRQLQRQHHQGAHPIAHTHTVRDQASPTAVSVGCNPFYCAHACLLAGHKPLPCPPCQEWHPYTLRHPFVHW